MFTESERLKILINCFDGDNTKMLLERNGYSKNGELTENGKKLFILVYEHYDCGMKLKRFL